MNDTDRLEQLEARFAWLERHVTEQDKAMLELSEELRRLRRECVALRARVGERDEGGAGGAGGEVQERPPHY